jgi:Tol biopolymer transport system component
MTGVSGLVATLAVSLAVAATSLAAADRRFVTRDGSARTNLTRSPEFHDDFHAYWSPNGKFIVWTALNWATSGGKSDIRVARFDEHGPSGTRLVDEHVVRPGTCSASSSW